MTPKEQFDAMLDDMDTESKLRAIEHIPFAKVLEELDPIAYRCGLADFEPSCESCGEPFWADDYDEEAICPECHDEALGKSDEE